MHSIETFFLFHLVGYSSLEVVKHQLSWVSFRESISNRGTKIFKGHLLQVKLGFSRARGYRVAFH